ncbi:unnamed protein product [Nippostrongylus brasiliensis]|uniref:Sugar phosphate phosphatase n=1 Tax=Nippostrongylus brasiliensis TaxID=27835 RepID=A0A0N4XNB6_NIPBR|nr:unnamed protein product [Nippostrongylus brasiliensis]
MFFDCQMGEDELTWYKVDWLFAECYMYRRIVGATAKTKYLKTFDFFREQKIEGFNSQYAREQIRDGIRYMLAVAQKLTVQQEKETLEVLLKAEAPIEGARVLDSFILCNDLGLAIESFFLKMQDKGHRREFHIVLDNAGPELMGELIFAEYLLQTNLAEKVVLHGKEYPYFVSDVTKEDFEWTLNELNNLGDVFRTMYEKLSARVNTNQLVFRDHRFWTYPQPYCEMRNVAPDLYSELSMASLIMFKGDLNYRKLVADRDWAYDTPFKVRR